MGGPHTSDRRFVAVGGGQGLPVADGKELISVFLPPDSPDLNLIEMAFSKLKTLLRGVGARTFDQLLQALGEICHLFTPDVCWSYFRHSGYAST
jgi:transposase